MVYGRLLDQAYKVVKFIFIENKKIFEYKRRLVKASGNISSSLMGRLSSSNPTGVNCDDGQVKDEERS